MTIEMNITDDASGVRFVVVNLSGPLGNSIVNGNATKVSGTALNGMYRVTLKVPMKSPKGDLAIDVWAQDLVGNSFNNPSAATVKQTGEGDVTAPLLVSTTATSSIDTSSAEQSVTIEMNITDDASGVRFVVVNLMSPLGNSIVQGDATKVSGTALDGKYRVTLKVPMKSPKGDLAIDVWARDLVGNDLNTRNAATVKQTGEGDVTAPVLVSTTATSPIDTSSSSQLVTIDMNITDDLSGVKSVVIYLNGPLGQIIETGNATKVSGTALNGMYQLKVTAPKKSPQGDLVIEVYVWDLAGNVLNAGKAATVKQTGA